MKVDLFDFDLPQELIAQAPARPRDSARLMVVPPIGPIDDLGVLDLADQLNADDLLVFNDTKVIPARLVGKRSRNGIAGAKIEITLHKADSPSRWRAFARPAKKIKLGDPIQFADGFSATVTDKLDGGEISLEFDRSGDDLIAALHQHGAMPLPPYIHRNDTTRRDDADDYQTMFARCEGAVAAPTAGLHFTDRLFERLNQRGIAHTFVTLHVGAGTFLPVKSEDTQNHRMHAEWGEITAETASLINNARARGNRIVAVGTTALRLLESAATADGSLHAFSADTDIFITPGYKFRVVDLLMTNFHLPRSTLFMLVSAFAGLERMQSAYTHARASGYRFYSYGDACLLNRIHQS